MALLLASTCGMAQYYDLILSTEGDSIACRIDSITDTHIYFEMKSANYWTPTSIEIARVARHELKVINKRDYLFKPGTTIIESAYTENLPRNSVYLGIMSVNYSRTLGGNPLGITLGVGFSYIDSPGILAEITGLKGRKKHFFEFGIMGVYYADFPGVLLRLGYRFQGPKGLLIRAAPLLGILDGKLMPLPALSLGYSF